MKFRKTYEKFQKPKIQMCWVSLSGHALQLRKNATKFNVDLFFVYFVSEMLFFSCSVFVLCGEFSIFVMNGGGREAEDGVGGGGGKKAAETLEYFNFSPSNVLEPSLPGQPLHFTNSPLPKKKRNMTRKFWVSCFCSCDTSEYLKCFEYLKYSNFQNVSVFVGQLLQLHQKKEILQRTFHQKAHQKQRKTTTIIHIKVEWCGVCALSVWFVVVVFLIVGRSFLLLFLCFLRCCLVSSFSMMLSSSPPSVGGPAFSSLLLLSCWCFPLGQIFLQGSFFSKGNMFFLSKVTCFSSPRSHCFLSSPRSHCFLSSPRSHCFWSSPRSHCFFCLSEVALLLCLSKVTLSKGFICIGFLERPSAKTKPTLCRGIVLFRLCPRETTNFSLSLCESFTREARIDLGQPVKVDAFEGARIKAFHHGFPRFTASHECAKWVPRCLFLCARNAVEAVNSLAPRLPGVSRRRLANRPLLAISRIIFKSASAPNGVGRVLVIVIDLFQD